MINGALQGCGTKTLPCFRALTPSRCRVTALRCVYAATRYLGTQRIESKTGATRLWRQNPTTFPGYYVMVL